MRTNTLRNLASGFVLSAVAGAALAAPLYDVSCLDCSLGFPLLPMDINANGVVVATDDVGCGFPVLCYGGQGYVLDHGIVTPTPSFDSGDLGSSAGAINDQNLVVGTASVSQPPQGPFAYAWDGTNMVDLGDAINQSGDGYFSRATSVNNRGHVVGHASGGYHDVELFVYKNGRMRQLPPLEGTHTENPYWYVRINDKDHIVGTSIGNLDDTVHAWINRAGVVTALAPDTYFSWAYGVNDRDEVAGAKRVYHSQNLQDYNDWAVVWSGGATTLLNTLPGFATYGAAYDINRRGWAVGQACGDTACTPFVFNRTKMFDLNKRLDSASAGWVLGFATAISDAGIIVGTGTLNGDFHAFMATPVVSMGMD
jgi:probable HAF family extracellular repeat protein